MLRPKALMPWAEGFGLVDLQRQAEVADPDLPDGAVVVEILVVIARRSISLSRIDIIFAGFFDNTLCWPVPLGVGIEARAGVGAGRGLFFLKLGVATKP
jgi:hypothetical protein